MRPVAVQLAQAAMVVVAVLALLLAFRPRPRTAARELALARAQWLTVAAAAVGLSLLTVAVLQAQDGNPYGTVTFLALCAYVAGATALVRPAWRRHRDLVREEEHVRWAASAGAEPRSRHCGLSGEEPPPGRW